ncbi:MAG: hypothetical protein KA387_00515 [Rubrivivax sp.]|nr:hypothetical protein [Rubrivivax sp.]
MNTDAVAKPRWATAADGEVADTSPGELSALGEHLALCRGKPGRLHALRHAAETMHGFAAARFITTMVVVVALFAAVVLVL